VEVSIYCPDKVFSILCVCIRLRAIAHPVPLPNVSAHFTFQAGQEGEGLRAQLESLDRTTCELRNKLDLAEKRINKLLHPGENLV
jgi:hypothetical protein